MRRAFTLVELLVVVAVLGILASMVSVAISSATGTARIARCRAQIASINTFIMHRHEAFLTLRIDTGTRVPDGTALHRDAVTGWVQTGTDAARNRLVCLREQMRIELPDRKSDLLLGSTMRSTQEAERAYDSAGSEVSQRLVTCTRAVPPQLTAYWATLTSLAGTNWRTDWSETNESSECLYLILSTTYIAGKSGLESVPESQIVDTDGDSVPEIVDPWGTPIVWMRWPVGYWLTYGQRHSWTGMTEPQRLAAMSEARQRLGPDQFDLLSADWRNRDASSANDTFNVLPLVASAGPDGELDLMLRSEDLLNPGWSIGNALDYAAMTWMLASAPHQAPYYNFDPYPNSTSEYTVNYLTDTNPFQQGDRGGWVGAYYDANGDEDNAADNIYSVVVP